MLTLDAQHMHISYVAVNNRVKVVADDLNCSVQSTFKLRETTKLIIIQALLRKI